MKTPGRRIEELLGHVTWLRELAHALVRDPGAADDLAQETWVTVLRRPPAPDVDARGWLSGVLKNLVRRRTRDVARRDRLHEDGARSEGRPGPDADVAEEEFRSRLAEAVAELREPYRDVVFLRYFGGLTAADVAARKGIPASTVRSHLKRGLDELRTRLDDRYGDRSSWSAVALAFARPAAPIAEPGEVPTDSSGPGASSATVLKGALAMKGMLQLTGIVAVLLTAGAGWWAWSGGEDVPASVDLGVRASSPDERAEPTVVPGVTGSAAVPVPVADEPKRAEPASDETLAAALEALAPSKIHATVVDAIGRPVGGARFRLDDLELEASSDARGAVRLEVPGVRFRRSRFAVTSPGLAPHHGETVLEAGRTVFLGEVVLGSSGSIAGRVEDRDGNGIEGVRVLATAVDSARTDPNEQRRHGPGDPWAPSVTSGFGGEFRFDDLPTGHLRLWAGGGELAWDSTAVEIAEAREGEPVVLVVEPLVDNDSIRGVVLDPDGVPVPGVRVHYSFRAANSTTASSLAAEDDGTFRLVVRHRVPHDFRARDVEERWGVVVAADAQPGDYLVLRFREASHLAVSLRDESGNAVERFELRAESTREGMFGVSHGPVARVPMADHPGGVARLGVPGEEFLLVVDAPGYELVEEGPFHPDSAPEELSLSVAPLPGIRGRVLADGEPVGGVDVTLYEVYDETTLAMVNGFRTLYIQKWNQRAETEPDGTFHLPFRGRGEYVLRADADGFAPAEYGPADIDGSVGLDEIVIELGEGGVIEGRVLVDEGRNPEGVIVGAHHGDGNPITRRTDPEGRFRFEGLAVGDWHVEERDVEVGQGSRSMTVGSGHDVLPVEWNCVVREGEVTRIELDLRDREDARLAGRIDLGETSTEGWTLSAKRLWGDDGMSMSFGETEDPTSVLAGDGTYALELRAGRYELRLRSPDRAGAALVLTHPIGVDAGENEWSLQLALGSIEGTGAVVPDGLDGFFVYDWYDQSRGLRAEAKLAPGPDGRFTLEHAPVGAGRVRRFRLPDDPSESGAWIDLARFEVGAGDRRQVDLR